MPAEASDVRSALANYDLVFFAGHGSQYKPLTRVSVGYPYNWTNVEVTDPAVYSNRTPPAGPKHHGDAITTQENWPTDDDLLTTTTAVAQRRSDQGDMHPYAVFEDGTQFKNGATRVPDREGRSPSAYSALGFAFFWSCNSGRTAASMSRLVGTHAPNASALGFARTMDDIPASKYNSLFWDEFAKYDWRRNCWPSCLLKVRDDSIAGFHRFYGAKRAFLIDEMFRLSDAMRYVSSDNGAPQWDTFTNLTR